MKTFEQWLYGQRPSRKLDEGDEGYWEDGEWIEGPDLRPKFSSEPPTLLPLPPGVQEQQPASRNFIRIDFSRQLSSIVSYKSVYIAFGKGQSVKDGKAAVELARSVVAKESGKYSTCSIFRMSKQTGNGIFSDEPRTKFGTGY